MENVSTLKQTTREERIYENLLKVEFKEEDICDNNHEKENEEKTLHCVINCFKRRLGLNSGCNHSVNLESFYEVEDKNHQGNSTKFMKEAINFAVEKNLIPKEHKVDFENILLLRNAMDTLVQRSARNANIIVATNSS